MLAGPHVPHGSSAPEERRMLSTRPELAAAVVELGAVSEAEKAWLLGRASLVLYPTVYEGFGLVPFEAAAHSVPCMWAAGTSLSELLDDDAAPLVAWDPAASADRALELMRDERERELNVGLIRRAAETLTWDASAARLLEVYEQTCDAPAAAAGVLFRSGGLINGAVTEDAARLIGPGGVLPPDVERPLLALSTHPRLAAPLFGALKFGYRTAFRLRRLRRSAWARRLEANVGQPLVGGGERLLRGPVGEVLGEVVARRLAERVLSVRHDRAVMVDDDAGLIQHLTAGLTYP